MEGVIQVPGEHRSELSEPCKDPNSSGLRIMAEDEDGWDSPAEDQARFLHMFVSGAYTGFPARNWSPSNGVRYGWNKEGVFLHCDHRKRYFGIAREHASVMLKAQVPEACPTVFAGGPVSNLGNTESMLSKLITNMPSITADMRMEVLRATFKRADTNGNGVLSRPELGSLFRKVVNTMSARQIEDVMAQADANNNGDISFEEFVKWLQSSAPEDVQNKLQRAVSTEADVVKASFRVWDENGDGLISRKELEKALGKMCKNLSDKQVKALCDLLDHDDDGSVDYDEFVDFLFHSHKGRG